jgi:hypothetical protein
MRILLFLFCLSVSAIAFAQVNLEDGLRLHYTFSGNVKDESGNKNDPADKKIKLVQDRFGNPKSACNFNGSNSYIRIKDASSLHTGDQISMCVWIKPIHFYNGKCHASSIISKGKPSGRAAYFLFFDDNVYRNDGNCYAKVDVQHQNYYGTGMTDSSYKPYTPYVELMEWVSVIYTYDGSMVRIYVGCDLVKSYEASSVYFTNTWDFYIGKNDSGDYPYWLNADLDDIRIYDRAINIDEVKQLQNVAVMQKQPGNNPTVIYFL